MNTEHNLVKCLLKKMNFEIIAESIGTKNGPDISAFKDGRVYTIEIKKVKPQRKNNFQIRPIEKKRRLDDFLAAVFPSGYILFEPMKDHLKSCSKSGQRNINGIT